MDRSGSKGYQLDLDRIWIGLRSNFQILDRIGSISTFELLDRIGIISKKIGSDPTLGNINIKKARELHIFAFHTQSTFHPTVTYTESGTPMMNWDSRYLCHFSTEMAEIWSPGTFSKGVWTHKISALYLLYFQSYETFSDVLSDFH